MKNVDLAILFAALSLGVTSCSTTLPGLTDQPANSDSKPYPLEACLVTGEGLESKTGSITKFYQGREVKICCQACLRTFKANPEPFMARLR